MKIPKGILIFIITVVLCLVLGFVFQNYGQTINPSVKQIGKYFYKGYSYKNLGNGEFIIFNNCDTAQVSKAAYSSLDWEVISDFAIFSKISKENLLKKLLQALNKIPEPVPVSRKVYFIAREDRLYQAAASNLYGIDSAEVELSRRSLTAPGGNYYRVVSMQGQFSDSTAMKENSNINYLVPYNCTLDSLRNYLNNVNSVPQWTEDIQ